jgi:hypothetical protein
MRAEVLARARKCQPTRPIHQVDRWRRYVQKYWDGTELDDENALLVATSDTITLEAANARIAAYFAAVQASDFPRSDLARAALAREEGQHPRFILDVLAAGDEIHRRLEHHKMLAELLGPRFSAAVNPIPWWAQRADAVHRLREFLRARHPEHLEPAWNIVAAFLWLAGSWRVNPDNQKSVKTLAAGYSRWLRELGPGTPR